MPSTAAPKPWDKCFAIPGNDRFGDKDGTGSTTATPRRGRLELSRDQLVYKFVSKGEPDEQDVSRGTYALSEVFGKGDKRMSYFRWHLGVICALGFNAALRRGSSANALVHNAAVRGPTFGE